MAAQPGLLTQLQRLQLIRALESSFNASTAAPDAAWLTRIEKAQMANPGDAALHYLAGITCMRLQLWGKAQQLLTQAVPRLQDASLQRNAWLALADMADHRGDAAAALQAWKNAAKSFSST
jgi:HemY protein